MTNLTIWTLTMGDVLTITAAAVYFYFRHEMGVDGDE